MAQPTKEVMETKWFKDLMAESLRVPPDFLTMMAMRLPVPLECYPKDRPFKICACRHFADYCDHIWQDNPRNIMFELRRNRSQGGRHGNQ